MKFNRVNRVSSQMKFNYNNLVYLNNRPQEKV